MLKLKFLLIPLSVIQLSSQYATAQMAQELSAQQKKLTLGDLIKKVKDESKQLKLGNATKNSVAVPNTKALFDDKKAVNLSAVKPPKLSEIYADENKEKGEYEKTLNQQINELYKLTQKFKTSSNRGELWLRLAELYVEKANIVDTRKQNEYDAKLAEYQAGRLKAKPNLDVAEAREFNKKAIQLYEWFLKDFPKDLKVPQALFFLGYNYFEIGNPDRGAAYYIELGEKYPTSNFTGEAHFAMGESLFDREKWVNAYKEYSYLVKDQKNSLHTVALYKAAWCLYRIGKTEEAIKYLDYIFKSGQRNKEQSGVAGRKINPARLEAESLKDLVVFFGDIGDTKRTINYFTNSGFKNYKDYIEKYAFYIADKGNLEASRDVFRYLISQDPKGKKAVDFQYQIVQNYFFSKNSPEFRTELYRWIIKYNAKSEWYLANKTDVTFINKIDQLRELTLRNYVLQQHQAAQNSRGEFSRNTTEQGYKIYFQEFNTSPMVTDMHFYYGELLYDIKKYAEAAVEYALVSDANPTNKFAEKASQNILLALEKILPKDEDLQKRVGNSTEPVKLDPISIKFMAAAKWNLEKYPKASNTGEIRFRIARLNYLTNNFDEAEKYFKLVVKFHPNTKLADYSANLLLDIYNLRNDYTGLEKMGDELLKNDYIASSQTGADIRIVLEKSSFKRAQNLEAERKYVESAIKFQDFASLHPKSELASVAFFNAAVNFERSARINEAISNYKKVISTTDKSAIDLKPKSKRLLAKLYQESGLFEEAAILYHELVREEPKDPLAISYQFNSALMYEMAGKTQLAITEYTKYIQINPNRNENAGIVFKIGNIKRREGKLAEAIERYSTYENHLGAKPEKKIEAIYWVYALSKLQGLKDEPANAVAKMRSLLPQVASEGRGFANSFVAKVKLDQAMEAFNRLKSILIPTGAKQKAAVDKKLEMFTQLNDQLGVIIKYDSAEEIVSALAILGDANQHMAETFQSVPIPAELSEENKKAYLDEVQKIINPFLAKAEESYKLAVDRAWALQVYTYEYKRAFAILNKKYPEQYYDSAEISYDSRNIDWMTK